MRQTSCLRRASAAASARFAAPSLAKMIERCFLTVSPEMPNSRPMSSLESPRVRAARISCCRCENLGADGSALAFSRSSGGMICRPAAIALIAAISASVGDEYADLAVHLDLTGILARASVSSGIIANAFVRLQVGEGG